MATNYKFKDLKVFSSDEWMANETKKYRTVFDRMETSYIRAEFSFYNKLFDEQTWKAKITLKAFATDGGKKEELCCLDFENVTINLEENIVYVRDGWGNAVEGSFWMKGSYCWEAYIDNEFVGKREFFIEDVGRVTAAVNPYFSVESVKLFAGNYDGWNQTERVYLKKFNRNETQYLWVELKVKIKTPLSYNYELFFNFYDDAGQPKGQTSRTGFVQRDQQDLIFTFDAGWGTDAAGSWKDDKYTVEIVFMDTLVALVPFEVGVASEEGVIEPITIAEQAHTYTSVSKSQEQANEENIEQLLQKLDELIGLEEIKKKIRDHISYINFIKLRNEKGFDDTGKLSLHSIFTGNPGTGKTTVVNMLGRLYKKMGLLSSGHVKEVDRADLVGQYIGQTAPRVKKAIEEAKGGILFIDEAYSLTRAKDSGNDFGQEVIEILLKEMSDGDGNIAIMCAGYPREMQEFIESNPGLKSRFSHHFHFEDYLPEEMLQIAEFAGNKKGITLTPAAKTLLEEILVEAYRNRDKTFGNARYVYSVIDEAKMNLGLRLMNHPNVVELSNEILSTVELTDVEKVMAGKDKKKLHLDINEKLLKEGLAELDALTGMDNIKQEVKELVKLARFYRETGRDVLNKFSLHSIFTGNPGTGKTTVARIIAKIYKGLGLLERGHVVEVDREGLVAGYVGQTAIKTAEKVDAALGGILFIDEAYALAGRHSVNDFGQEAIQVILKRMEDLRGQFGVIVAGYTENMAEFVESNPGLKSRFDRNFRFNDYSENEMFAIAKELFAKENIKLEPKAEEHLKTYFSFLFNNRDKHFGNARTIRQVVGESIKNQNLRLSEIPAAERTKELLETVTFDDVKEFEPEQRSVGSSLGFKLGAR